MANESSLVRVKFFGPNRKEGKLWGYVSVFVPVETQRDIYVTEPAFFNKRIPEGTLGTCFIDNADKRSNLSRFEPWSASERQIEVLLKLISEFAEHNRDLPSLVQDLIRRLKPHLAHGIPREHLTDQQIAVIASASFQSLIAELNRTIAGNREIGWFSRISKLPISSRDEFEDVSSLLVEHLGNSAVADSLVKSASNLKISLLNTRVFSALPAETQLRTLLLEVSSKGWMPETSLSLATQIRDLIPRVDVHSLSFLLSSMPPDFLLDFPELLKADRSPATRIASRALSASSKRDKRSAPFIQHVEEVLSEAQRGLSTLGFQRSAAFQAKVVLGFHPSLARRCAEKNLLLAEVEHQILCVRGSTCLHKQTLEDIVGHAIGDFTHSSATGGSFNQNLWISRLSALVHSPRSEDVESVALLVQELALHLLGRGELKSSVGLMSRLLPRCSPGEAPFCEGKPPSEGFSDPFCPRTKRGCGEAITGPKRSRDFEDLSLMDIIGTAVTTASVPLNRKTLLNTLAGWVNRLLEVEDRLICQGCSERLVVDPEYSKKYTARYAATLFRCPENCGGEKVYLSHCFHCSAIIDSRESQFSYNDSTGVVAGPGKRDQASTGTSKYLCIKCANDFKPACPSCGEASEAATVRDVRTCSRCGHSVWRSRKYRLPKVDFFSTLRAGSENLEFVEHERWGEEPGIRALRHIANSHGDGF